MSPVVNCPNCHHTGPARRAPGAARIIGWCLLPLLVALAALYAISEPTIASRALLAVPPLAILVGIPVGLWAAWANAPLTCAACHFPYVTEQGPTAVADPHR